jgi:hypothetical protein
MQPDTIRRLIAGLATFAAPFVAAFLNSKGITVTDAQVAAAVAAGLGYIGQSVVNTLHARSVAASQQPSPVAAVADLNKGPA